MDDFDDLQNLSKAELKAMGIKLTRNGKIDKRAYMSSENNIKKALQARKQLDEAKLSKKYEDEEQEVLYIEEETSPTKPTIKKTLKQDDYLVEVKQSGNAPPLKQKSKSKPEPESEEDEPEEPVRKSKGKNNEFSSELFKLKEELYNLKLDHQRKEMESIKQQADKQKKLKIYEQIIPLFN